jgi:hypothetical protein
MTPRHRGDLGSISVYSGSSAYYDYTTDYIGDLSTIIGRGFVVHELVDHGDGANCDATGSAGRRLMVCTIGWSQAVTVDAAPTGTVFPNAWSSIDCVNAMMSDSSAAVLRLSLAALVAFAVVLLSLLM